MSQDNHLPQFLQILNSWKFGYSKVLCKYFVLKDGEKRNLLYGLIAFISENPNQIRDFHIETEHLIAGQELFDANDEYFTNLLKNMKDKPHVLNSKNHSFSLPHDENSTFSYYYNPINFHTLDPSYRSPNLQVATNNKQISIPDDRIVELELKSCETPFDNLQDFFSFTGLPVDVLRSGESAYKIHVLATSPIANMQYKIEGKKTLDVKFFFSNSVKKDKFKMGIRFYNDGIDVQRFTALAKDFTWDKEGDKITAHYRKDFDNIEVARIFPTYDNQNICSLVAVDPNIILNNRVEAYNVFFEKEKLQSFLHSKDAAEFEFGISALLHKLKLSPMRYSGIAKLSNGPDILAFSSFGHIYVIECTTGDPNHKGKLQKLHNRSELLKQQLQAKGFDRELIRPMLFTNLPKENTLADTSSLANYRISLVTKEDLDGLLTQIANPPKELDIFEAALKAIPTVEQDNQLKLLK